MAKSEQVFNIRPAEKDFAFSQAIRAGNMLFVSGTVSWDKEAQPLDVNDMAAQIKNVYDELGLTLDAHGANFSNVVKETVYTTDMAALAEAAPVRAGYFSKCAPPASTWVEITRLVHPDLLLEVEITAILD